PICCICLEASCCDLAAFDLLFFCRSSALCVICCSIFCSSVLGFSKLLFCSAPSFNFCRSSNDFFTSWKSCCIFCCCCCNACGSELGCLVSSASFCCLSAKVFNWLIF